VSRTAARRTAALLAAAAGLPVLAYVLPAPAILKAMGERRAEVRIVSLEVHGVLEATGAAAERLAPAAGLQAVGGRAIVPARLALKSPGRCRLEILPAGVPESDRPHVMVRGDALAGRGLEPAPALAALVRSTCALLAVPPTPAEAAAAWTEALARRGVSPGEATLGRFDGRIAYVLGGRARDAKPLLFVDKEALRPLRLLATDGGVLLDTRLVGWGSPVGGDWFPRAVEVHERERLLLRFSAEKVAANPKLPDALF
jgi:hypothetical protein